MGGHGAPSGGGQIFSHKTQRSRILFVPAIIVISIDRKTDKFGNDNHVFACADHQIRTTFARISAECGIIHERQKPNGRTLHDLRHTALTHLLQSNVDIATLRATLPVVIQYSETSQRVHPTEQSRRLLATLPAAISENTVSISIRSLACPRLPAFIFGGFRFLARKPLLT